MYTIGTIRGGDTLTLKKGVIQTSTIKTQSRTKRGDIRVVIGKIGGEGANGRGDWGRVVGMQ